MEEPINWHSFFFLLFALAACAFALAVVISSNIVRMALYLVLSLAATSGLFFLTGADFVGAMQLLIYVGGTLVLLVFGVMLTAQGPFISMRTRAGEWVLAAIVGGSLLAILVQTAFQVDDWRSTALVDHDEREQVHTPTAAPIGLGLLGIRADAPATGGADEHDWRAGYLLPFEIVSVHLLVVLIGAAYLARSKRRAYAPRLKLAIRNEP